MTHDQFKALRVGEKFVYGNDSWTVSRAWHPVRDDLLADGDLGPFPATLRFNTSHCPLLTPHQPWEGINEDNWG